jgi:hypothetical protein
MQTIPKCLVALALTLSSSSALRASPLDWLKGNYHGSHRGSTLLEHWEITADGRALGTTVWNSPTGVELQELLSIRPLGKDRYRLDLWIWSAGFRQHKVMTGGLQPGRRALRFEAPPDQHPESLSYEKDVQGNLRVTLSKKALTRFVLQPVASDTWRPLGDYEAHTFFEEQAFIDTLKFSTGADGLQGSLEVPGKFTTALEHLHCRGRQLHFECSIPEGDKPYRVGYFLKFTKDGSQAVGVIQRADTGQHLGSVVLRRKPSP